MIYCITSHTFQKGMKEQNKIWISVIGGARANSKILVDAHKVGELLAKSGAIVVCGGLGGVMEAVSAGAKKAGGTVVGILPSDKRSDANRFVDIAIPTGLGIARNLLVVRAGDAVIAIDGEWGTLSEIALAKSSDKYVVGLHTKAIDGIVKARSPEDAVKKALTAARNLDK